MSDMMSKTGNDLLLCPEVVVAYWGLKGVIEWAHKLGGTAWIYCIKCEERSKDHGGKLCRETCVVPDPVPGPIERVAFEMRDACKPEVWREALATITRFAPEFSCADNWIKAATLAYEEQDK